MASKRLANKIAIITGANSGIGLATVNRFIAEGATVVAFDRDISTVKNITHAFQGDVSKVSDIAAFYDKVKTIAPRVDIVFANAGVCKISPLDAITEENYDYIFDINAKGAFFTVQKALPLMTEGGSVIFTASVAGVKGLSSFSLYCGTKAAIRGFTRSFAAELSGRKIRVNQISPGPIDTPIFDAIGGKATMDPFAAMTPMGRAGVTHEISDAATFLASNDSSYITGIDLFVDGGMAQV